MSECVSGVGRRAREWAGVVTGKWSRTVMVTASVDYELIKLMVGKPACFDRVSSQERERQFRVTCVFFRFFGNVVAGSWLVPILIDSWCMLRGGHEQYDGDRCQCLFLDLRRESCCNVSTSVST